MPRSRSSAETRKISLVLTALHRLSEALADAAALAEPVLVGSRDGEG